MMATTKVNTYKIVLKSLLISDLLGKIEASKK